MNGARMQSGGDPRCSRRDDVVALFLDGDVDGMAFVEREELDEHRAVCDDCREALERARRLDALVAGCARADVAGEVPVEDWLDAALATVPAETSAPRLRLAAAALLVAVLFIAGIAVGLRLGTGGEVGESERSEPELIAAGAVDLGPEWSPGTIVLTDGPFIRRTRGAIARPTPEVLATMVRSAQVRLAAVPIALWSRGLSASWADVLEIERSAREQAARSLAQSTDRDALQALVSLAAELPDGLPNDRRLEAVVVAVRGARRAEDGLVRALRSGDTRALWAAARVGGRRLDRAIVVAVDGSPERAQAVADLLRTVEVRPGRAELLLSLWREVDARERIDAEAFAGRLFGGLGAADTVAVCGVLRGSRHGAERARCLTALAALRSSLATDALWKVLAGSNRDEAQLAAFALGRAPAGGDDLAARRPSSQQRGLWLAALASRGELRARREIERLSVTAEERAFLIEGQFSPQQIGIAVRLFGARGGRTD